MHFAVDPAGVGQVDPGTSLSSEPRHWPPTTLGLKSPNLGSGSILGESEPPFHASEFPDPVCISPSSFPALCAHIFDLCAATTTKAIVNIYSTLYKYFKVTYKEKNVTLHNKIVSICY